MTMIYGSEFWPMKKALEKKVDMADMPNMRRVECETHAERCRCGGCFEKASGKTTTQVWMSDEERRESSSVEDVRPEGGEQETERKAENAMEGLHRET